jgi:hypothetical protein
LTLAQRLRLRSSHSESRKRSTPREHMRGVCCCV